MTTPQAQYAAALQGLVTSEIELSVPTQLVLDTAWDAVGKVAGQALETIGADALEALPAELSEAVGEAVQGLVQAVPLVSTAFSLLGAISAAVSAAEGGSTFEKIQNDCAKQYRDRLPPKEGGLATKGGVLPSSIFVPKWLKYETAPLNWVPGGNYHTYRPVLGEGLICVTEGWQMDSHPDDVRRWAEEWDRTKPHAAKRAAEAATYGADRRRRIAANLGWDPFRRREVFEKMRRAIQAANPTKERSADGGVGLWPAYLDLLVADGWAGADESAPGDAEMLGGHRAAYQLAICAAVSNKAETDAQRLHWTETAEKACHWPHLAKMIRELVYGWKRTAIEPTADQDKVALAEARRELERRKERRPALWIGRRKKLQPVATYRERAGRWLETPAGRATAVLVGGGALVGLGAVALRRGDRRRSD